MAFLIWLAFVGIVIAVIFLPVGKCPKCGGKLKKSFYDAGIDKQVYKCEFCGTEYI